MNLVTEKINLPQKYSITEEATVYVGWMLRNSQQVAVVLSHYQQNQAVSFGREFRKLLAEVRQTHKELKAPLRAGEKMLDTLLKDYEAPILAEITRLEALAEAFQKQEDARIEAENLARQAELDRLAQERLKAEHAVEDSNGDAQAEAVLEQAEQAERALMIAPEPEPAKTPGLVRGEKVLYEITSIHELYWARPDLVKLEPKMAEIRANCFPGMQIPGLKITTETRTTIRR